MINKFHFILFLQIVNLMGNIYNVYFFHSLALLFYFVGTIFPHLSLAWQTEYEILFELPK